MPASGDLIAEVLERLDGVPAAHGHEHAAAESLAAWGRQRLPGVTWTVDRFDGDRANLLVEAGAGTGPAFGLYAHLDTSLTGAPDVDAAVTGRTDPVAPLRHEDGELVGHGLAVARGSVAAAVAALAATSDQLAAGGRAHRIQLLLASGGTHRLAAPGPGGTPSFGVGVRRALARGFRPGAVLNVKAGAPAPLAEEPGAAYLALTVSGSWDPVLFRGDDPGTPGALPAVLAAVERVRRDRRALAVPAGSTSGRELGLGAVRLGALDKPDLLPATLEAAVFAVLAPGDDPQEVAEQLERALAEGLADVGGGPLRAAARVLVSEAGAATDRDQPLVGLVDEAWRAAFGPPPAVAGWRGSTDGVVLRAAGIPTVRVGPLVARDQRDPRLDRVPLATLAAFADLYAAVGRRWVGRQPPLGPARPS